MPCLQQNTLALVFFRSILTFCALFLQFLVPRQAASAAGSNAKSPAAGQAAQPAAGFKRLQLVRPGAPSAAKKPATNLPEKPSKITKNDVQKVSLPETVKQLKASLPRNLLPRPSPSLPAAQAPVAAAAPSGAPRRAFRIPTLPADALPSLSALFQLEKNSISSFLAGMFLVLFFHFPDIYSFLKAHPVLSSLSLAICRYFGKSSST